MILAGDIGGTKTQLGLFEIERDSLSVIRKAVFPSQNYSGLDQIITEFLVDLEQTVTAACFGVAGPVIDGNCTTTNLPWVVNSSRLAGQLSLGTVTLLNDLEAIGYGVPLLEPHQICVLNEGEHVPGNCGIIAAGTGLGEAGLFWDGERHIPSASEGGHVDFAPRDEIEIELLRFMFKKFDRVSVERIVSGPGLLLIYEFLRDSGYGSESGTIAARFAEQDPSSVISAAALTGECPLSARALDLFTGMYGATAGNLALTLMATGGIYIAGGIAPKVIEKLQDGTFLRAFTDKGRFSALLSKIPVLVVLNDEVPLLGAARVAAGMHR